MGNFCSIIISPDLQYTLRYQPPYTFLLWSVKKDQEISELPLLCTIAWPSFSPDGKLLAVNNLGKISIYETTTGSPVLNLVADNIRTIGRYTSLVFSPDSKIFVIRDYSSENMLFWNTVNGGYIGSYFCGGECWRAAFSPDGKTLAINSFQGNYDSIILLDFQTRKPLWMSELHFHNLAGITFSPDGKIIAALDTWNTVRILDAANGNLISSFTPIDYDPNEKNPSQITRDALGINEPNQINGFNTMAFTPDGKILAIGYSMGSIILWNVETTQPVFVYKSTVPDGMDEDHCYCGIESIVFSSDGTLMGSSNLNNTVTIWGIP